MSKVNDKSATNKVTKVGLWWPKTARKYFIQ